MKFRVDFPAKNKRSVFNGDATRSLHQNNRFGGTMLVKNKVTSVLLNKWIYDIDAICKPYFHFLNVNRALEIVVPESKSKGLEGLV